MKCRTDIQEPMKNRLSQLKWIMHIACVAIVLSYASLLKAQISINEIMPANSSMYMDSTWNYSGWAEFYNQGDAPVNLCGYYLSDTPSNPEKYRIPNEYIIPSKGYAVYWFGHHDLSAKQANFKLDCEGATLYLYSPSGELVESLLYPEQVQNTSYARIAEGGNTWGYCLTPTPGSSNAGSLFAYERCPEPQFSLKGGVYRTGYEVSVTCPEGMRIHYTTDCSEPSAVSPLWISGDSKAFSATTILRARVLAEGYLPGTIITHSYILSNRELLLPVSSIVTDPKNLWDDMIGIYCQGKNGKQAYAANANWNQDWQRPANFEYLSGTEQLFSQQCDIAIGGGFHRTINPLKSLKLNAEKKYDGKNKFNYPFFDHKPGLKFKSLLLRNAGNDFRGAMMADAMQHVLVQGMLDVEYQPYQPTIHYINGQYYGIINLRERNNQQYVYSNFGYDNDSIDLIEHGFEGYEVINGSVDALDRLVSLSEKAVDPVVYNQVKDLMDMDEFIAYLVTQIYCANWDWPRNNTKIFRHQNNGKFRWILFDLDGGFYDPSFSFFTDKDYGMANSIVMKAHTSQLFRNLLKSEEFKYRFLDYFTLCIGSVFETERVISVIDSLAANISKEIPYHMSRWGVTNQFSTEINRLKKFAKERPVQMLQILGGFLSLGNPVGLSVGSNIPHATLCMNGIAIPTGSSNFYTFKDRELTFKAENRQGYRFEGWRVARQNEAVISPYGSEWKYYDKGGLDGIKWQPLPYKASVWGIGNAPFGFGLPGVVTTLTTPNTQATTYPAYYFRHLFSIGSLNIEDIYTLHLMVDDGAVVYINGNEIGRYLIGTSTIYFGTTSKPSYNSPDYVEFSIPASYLVEGENVLSVEVHQESLKSTDLYLDAQITRRIEPSSEFYPESEIILTAEKSLTVTAEYRQLETTMLSGIPPVRINEVSASNTIHVNEYFKTEDWIELYNPADTAVSIAGMYISNVPENPLLYRIPESSQAMTVIPPHGYRILWADKQQNDTQLHLPFKLAAEGGLLQLTGVEEDSHGEEAIAWKEQLMYVLHSSEHTFGRYPDGGDSLYIMNRNTFSASNFFSIYSMSVPNPYTDVEQIRAELKSADPEISMYYYVSSGELALEMEEEASYAMEIVISTLSGQIAERHTLQAGQKAYSLLLHLPSGYYLATLYSPEKTPTTVRFVR